MISVYDSKELQAAVLAMKAADRDLKRKINQDSRQTMNPVWQSLVSDHLSGRDAMTDRMLNNGVRIAAGNPPVAKAAQSSRAIGRNRRLIPRQDFAGWEFGVPDRNAYSRYERKNRRAAGYHWVERRTMKHLPRRHPQGRVVYPAFAEIAPRMVKLWVQTIMRTYFDAAEGK